MDIYRNQSQPLTVLESLRKRQPFTAPQTSQAASTPEKPAGDRRAQPDRRRVQVAFEGPDRRKKRSRRSPRLLNPKTGQEAPSEDRRGRLVSTRA
ncbi:hypothetical protein [Marinobacter sp. HL-58]|uniref:hypothetical protein n=1 Tax=Marinobacter sp. HL-58 TaxID=1479237 RepID=UPI000483EF95|nr:hypothetical protein [Marinobacter sp. HL-58]KPP97924.1 MAG: hypothetical protein HLUCCO03_08700 [Marinobacter sp. HL-58]